MNDVDKNESVIERCLDCNEIMGRNGTSDYICSSCGHKTIAGTCDFECAGD